jgi:hypothetical protein
MVQRAYLGALRKRLYPAALVSGLRSLQRLQRLGEAADVPPRERRKAKPHREHALGTPFGHLEVDAALQGSGEGRIRAEALPEAQRPGCLFHVELDAVGRLFEAVGEVP